MGGFHHVSPPLCQHVVAGRVAGEGPVNLRRDIVQPSLLHPETGIGIGLIVGRRAAGVGTGRIVGAVAPDACRTDAEFNLGVQLLDGTGNLLDQQLGIMPPPVRLRGKSLTVLLERPAVVQRRSRRFGVEIVVELDAVNRIMFHDFRHDTGYPVAHFRDARIEHEAIAGGAYPLGVQNVYAGGNLR